MERTATEKVTIIIIINTRGKKVLSLKNSDTYKLSSNRVIRVASHTELSALFFLHSGKVKK